MPKVEEEPKKVIPLNAVYRAIEESSPIKFVDTNTFHAVKQGVRTFLVLIVGLPIAEILGVVKGVVSLEGVAVLSSFYVFATARS